MTPTPLPANVLAVRLIPKADRQLLRGLGASGTAVSLGILTATSDDVAYAALDEATKRADVGVVYAKSMYAGAANASMPLAGECIGVLAGPGPEEVASGLRAAVEFIEHGACFYSAREDGGTAFFAHCVSRTGSFLSAKAGVEEGTALAYLIAPPLEATYGLDAALKAAEVEMRVFYGPPTETNFAGGLLAGEEAACRAACDAFAEAVCDAARNPMGLYH